MSEHDPGAWDPSDAAPHQPADGPLPGVWPDEQPRLVGRWVGVVGALVLVLLGGFALICVGGVVGVGLLAVQSGGDMERLLSLAEPENLSGAFLFTTFVAGFGAFAVLGTGLTLGLGWRPRHALALRAPPVAALVVGGLGSLFVGLFPGWVAERIMEAFPELGDRGTLEAISRMLVDGSPVDQLLMVLTVVVGAPLLEEICFRGLLWNMLERVLPGQGGQALAFVLTSVAFVLAHFDPVQSPALIFTAFFFGWIRWMGGSLWPCILAHFVNNGLAALLTVLSVQLAWEEAAMPVWLAAVGVGITLAAAGALLALRRRPAATPEAAWAEVATGEVAPAR